MAVAFSLSERLQTLLFHQRPHLVFLIHCIHQSGSALLDVYTPRPRYILVIDQKLDHKLLGHEIPLPIVDLASIFYCLQTVPLLPSFSVGTPAR